MKAHLIALILAVFGPAHGQQAVRVATCESNLRPRVVSQGNVGIFQINQVHRRRGESYASFVRRLQNPRTNIAYAYRLSRHGRDWSAWRWSQHCWGRS